MKTITAYIYLALITFSLQAQTTLFEEDFESGAFPPEDWISFRGLDNVGEDFDWISLYNSNTDNTSAYSRFSSFGIGIAEDWLVTPLIDLTYSQNTTLSFYSREAYSTEYMSQYNIMISTTSQNTHSDFTTITTYSDFSLNYEEITVDLSAYDGQQIYIAFVHIDEYQDDWYLDDIQVNATTVICDINNTAESNTSLGRSTATRLYGQEFIANCNGSLDKFAFFARVIPEIDQVLPAGTFNIYEGNPENGTIIYSQYFDAIVPVGNGELLFNLNTDLQLIANQNYTLEIPVTFLNISTLYTNPYPNGAPYINGVANSSGWDFFFAVDIDEENLNTNTYEDKLLSFFPNPATNNITITGNIAINKYTIYNILGEVIKNGVLDNQKRISVKHLESGMYFIKFNNGANLKFLKK